MTQQEVHVIIGEDRAIFGVSTVSREEAHTQAQERYDELRRENPSPYRYMAMYALITDPEAIAALGDISTLTTERIDILMYQGRVQSHAGITM